MGHSLHVIPIGLRAFEWTAVLERGTLNSGTYKLRNGLFIRALTFTLHWALVRDLSRGQIRSRDAVVQKEKAHLN